MLRAIVVLCAVVVTVCGSQEEEHEHHEPQPYHFGYEVKDKHGSQFRKEHSDGHGHVEGSYGYTDEKGIYREVHYVADKNGYRAKIKTNEPGTKSEDPADVSLYSSAKYEVDEEYFKHEPEQGYAGNEYRKSDNSQFNRRQGDHGGHE